MASNSSLRSYGSASASRYEIFVIPLLLAGIAFIGYMIFRLQLRADVLPLLALCSACLGVLVVIRPSIGFVAIVVCAALVKISIGTGTGSDIVTSLLSATLLVAGWLAHQMLHRKRINYLPPWIALSALSLVGFTLFSWAWGRATIDPRIDIPVNFYRVQMAQAALIIISVGLLFVGADLLRNRSSRSLLMGAIIVVGLVALPFRAFVENFHLINTAGVFGIWFVSLSWANATMNDRLPRFVRIVLGASAFGWLLMAITREGVWVSGWLPVFLALWLVSFMAGPRVAVPVTLTGIIGILAYSSFFYYLLVTAQVDEGSLSGQFGRFELWKRALLFAQDYIVFGSGPAGYALYYVTFLPDQAMSTHSNYIDILAQTGIAGIASFAALLGGLLVLGVRTWRTLTDTADRTLCAAVLGALPALMFSLWFGDWLIPFVYNQTIAGFDHSVYSWLMLAALCGLMAQQRQQQEHPDG